MNEAGFSIYINQTSEKQMGKNLDLALKNTKEVLMKILKPSKKIGIFKWTYTETEGK